MSLSNKASVLLAALLFTSVALAQIAPPTRLRGVVETIDGRSLTIKTRADTRVSVDLAPNATLMAPKPLSLAEINPGDFIGTAAMPAKDGFVALEVLVFPASMRGTGEGHYEWDLEPGSTMTNANVDAVVTGNAGRDLTLSYKGGSAKVHVPEGTPIVTPLAAELSDFKIGAHVFLTATKGDDGRLVASRAWVEKDGVIPPM